MTSAAGDGAALRSGFVALFGWTNVGKSTLLNRLVGAKLAAVADVAQTTRQRITGVLSLPGRGQVVFIDTPGLHRPRHKMNRAMVESTRQALRGVDVAVLIIDAHRGIGEGDRQAFELLRGSRARQLVVLNKVDRVRPKSRLLPMIEALAREMEGCEIVPISALDGSGCDALLNVILDSLPIGQPQFPADFLTDQSERSLAAEWIREQLLHETRQELPHATAVEIEHWHEREDGLLEIEASILVDRDSQKRIVIGRHGELVKRIGTAARGELEALLERRVYLRLWVKVRQDWRDDDRVLDRLGLG